MKILFQKIKYFLSWLIKAIFATVIAVIAIFVLILFDGDEPDDSSNASKEYSYSIPQDLAEYKVKRVVDGDTIEVFGNWFGEKPSFLIRYKDIDTPEVRKKIGNKWVDDFQCFGKEASEFNKDLVEGKTILFEPVEIFDKYKRALGYVYIDDIFVNGELVRTGHGEVFLYGKTGNRFSQLSSLEENAKKNKDGMWEKCFN